MIAYPFIKSILNKPHKIIVEDVLKNVNLIELPIVKKIIRHYKNKDIWVGYYYIEKEEVLDMCEGSVIELKLLSNDGIYIYETGPYEYRSDGTFTVMNRHQISIEDLY